MKMRSKFRTEAAAHTDANREFADRRDGGASWQWFIVTLIAFMFLNWLDLPGWR
jgi:hypothetical protein